MSMAKISNRTYYVCPRCSYKSYKNTDMIRHFNRKRICADKNGVVFTDEMKKTVLENFECHISRSNNLQSVNNLNMMLGIVNSTETLDKVRLLTDHKGIKITDIEDELEKQYEYMVKRLENDDMTCGYLLKLDDLFNIVNTCTSRDAGEPDHFNVFFDKMVNRLKLFRSKNWETFLEDAGIKQLISLIKSYYLDSYEVYLIRNLHSTQKPKVNPWQLKDHLIIYYQFIAVFELEPYITSLQDDEVVGHRLLEYESDFLSKTYYKLYNEHKKELKESVIKSVKRTIINIVKDNSLHNIKMIDKTIIDLLKIDEAFRNELIKTRQLSL